MPISVNEFIDLHPKLYHMAEANSWPSIQQHGLLSTEALLDLFQVTGLQRHQILECQRPESVSISHPVHGNAVVRDQKPMSDKALYKCLQGGLVPSDWYKMLNGKTFFWTTKERLLRLLGARAYRGRTHCVLTVDTSEMLARHMGRITLCPLNSGSTIMNPQPRGNSTFLPLAHFPYSAWRKKGRGKTGVFAELVVDYSVPDVTDFTDRVDLMHETRILKNIHNKQLIF